MTGLFPRQSRSCQSDKVEVFRDPLSVKGPKSKVTVQHWGVSVITRVRSPIKETGRSTDPTPVWGRLWVPVTKDRPSYVLESSRLVRSNCRGTSSCATAFVLGPPSAGTSVKKKLVYSRFISVYTSLLQ